MLRVALLSCILISITFSEWPACFILFGPQGMVAFPDGLSGPRTK